MFTLMWQTGERWASHAAAAAAAPAAAASGPFAFFYTLSLSIITEARSPHAWSIQKAFTFYSTLLLYYTAKRHFTRNLKRSLLPGDWRLAMTHSKASCHSCPSDKTYYQSARLFIRLCESWGGGRSQDNGGNPFGRDKAEGCIYLH